MMLPRDSLARSPLSIADDADGEILIVTGSCVYRLTAGEQLLGDANHNGIVDVADLNIVGQNWLMSGRTYEEGDFNGDGMVEIADLSILASSWQLTNVTATAVPEPSCIFHSIGILLLAFRWQVGAILGR